jgi:iron complex transport system ATP-binding protein
VADPEHRQAAAALAVEGVRFSRKAGFRLGPLDLELRDGEVLALLGPNGAGKTTLLELAAGVLRPESGSVKLFGREAARIPHLHVARLVALLPQGLAFPFPMAVEEVVMQGRWPHLRWLRIAGSRDRAVAEEAMRRTGVEGLRGRDVRTLSSGERQRVLLAKALAQRPRLLLLDEPTANLDPGHQARILDRVAGEAREGGLAVLLASHDLNVAAAYADRVLVLRDGEAVASGAPAEVLTQELLREVYDAPLLVEPDPRSGRPRIWLESGRDGGAE